MMRTTTMSISARVVGLLLVASLAAACGTTEGQAVAEDNATLRARALADAVTLDGAVKHLQAFQDIADRNGGNRALGTPGYEQSVDYAEKVLRDAGYHPERKEFTLTGWQSKKVELQVAGAGVGAYALQFSGATDGTLTGRAAVTGNPGCTADELSAVTPGSIAVVQRGNCEFGVKYRAAAAKGAKALILTNNAAGDWKGGTLGLSDAASIPVVGVAREAAIADGQDVALTVDAGVTKVKTWNVIADTEKGDANNVQMVGAHLDGVEAGPGINDNGTGSAAVLETAVRLGAGADVKNKVRFALWGAEEEGLLGSEKYVQELSKEEAGKIKRYLNFDMLGSPNGGYFTFDGDGSSKLEGGAGPAGSDVIERVFRDYFAWRNVTVEASAFDGRSDYGPFKEAGIASGGMDTGADGKKTDAQQRAWGGTVGEIYDPNYHTARDTLANVNRDMYRVSLGSVGFATAYFAAL